MIRLDGAFKYSVPYTDYIMTTTKIDKIFGSFKVNIGSLANKILFLGVPKNKFEKFTKNCYSVKKFNVKEKMIELMIIYDILIFNYVCNHAFSLALMYLFYPDSISINLLLQS